MRNAAEKLIEPGVVMISTKQGRGAVRKKDEFGERLFYLYEPDDLIPMASDRLEPHSVDFQHIGRTDWFTLILRKRHAER